MDREKRLATKAMVIKDTLQKAKVMVKRTRRLMLKHTSTVAAGK